MKTVGRLLALAMLSSVLVAAPAPADIAGQWQFTVELSMGTGKPIVTFKQDGAKLTGTYEGRYGASRLEGTVKENEVEFTVTQMIQGEQISGTFSGVVEAGAMRGDVEYEGAGEGTWTAVRIPAKK
jgi:hypothetical protein